jgi:hypothetical protein
VGDEAVKPKKSSSAKGRVSPANTADPIPRLPFPLTAPRDYRTGRFLSEGEVQDYLQATADAIERARTKMDAEVERLGREAGERPHYQTVGEMCSRLLAAYHFAATQGEHLLATLRRLEAKGKADLQAGCRLLEGAAGTVQNMKQESGRTERGRDAVEEFQRVVKRLRKGAKSSPPCKLLLEIVESNPYLRHCANLPLFRRPTAGQPLKLYLGYIRERLLHFGFSKSSATDLFRSLGLTSSHPD